MTKEPLDERVRLPHPFRDLLVIALGICIVLLVNDHHPENLKDSFRILAYTIASAFIFWGIVSFINDVKRGGNWEGFKKIVKSKLKFEPYDITNNDG